MAGGRSTPLMTWTTPFDAAMFAFMTCTVVPLPSVMVSFPSAALTVKVAPLTVLTAPGWILRRLQGSGHDVVEQDARQLGLIGRLEE